MGAGEWSGEQNKKQDGNGKDMSFHL